MSGTALFITLSVYFLGICGLAGGAWLYANTLKDPKPEHDQN